MVNRDKLCCLPTGAGDIGGLRTPGLVATNFINTSPCWGAVWNSDEVINGQCHNYEVILIVHRQRKVKKAKKEEKKKEKARSK